MENPINPYAAPQSNTLVLDEPVQPVPASKITRLLNLIIDYLMQIILVVVFAMIVILIGGDEAMAKLEKIPNMLLGFIAMFTYYLSMEATLGRTVGKLVTGTKVVNEDGQKASFLQVLGRTFARIIPFEAFTFLGSETRGWHDEMPKTYVVKCR